MHLVEGAWEKALLFLVFMLLLFCLLRSTVWLNLEDPCAALPPKETELWLRLRLRLS